eukprot:scaffold72823_cov63-Phaeocystis_antarctica.AAC.2
MLCARLSSRPNNSSCSLPLSSRPSASIFSRSSRPTLASSSSSLSTENSPTAALVVAEPRRALGAPRRPCSASNCRSLSADLAVISPPPPPPPPPPRSLCSNRFASSSAIRRTCASMPSIHRRHSSSEDACRMSS